MSIESDKDNKYPFAVTDRNNPQMYNGRSVKLNIKLTGDVLEMVTQTCRS